jgi:hypothetical protein
MVATEFHFLSDTVELPVIQPGRIGAERGRMSFCRRLESGRLGRSFMTCLRWSLVAGLILSGYYTAAGINAALQLLPSGPATQHIIAASVHRE